MRGCPALGCANDAIVALPAADQRRRDRVSARLACGGHQQHVVAPHADPTALLGVELVDRLLIPCSCFHGMKSTQRCSVRVDFMTELMAVANPPFKPVRYAGAYRRFHP